MAHVINVGEDDVLVGSVVSERYLVREILGQGTIGTVFRVENIHLGRPAAMKVLRARYLPLDAIQRVFQGEARSAWSVTHACLCEVFDVGSLPDGMPYFVMERLEGETLATRIARERLSLASAADVVMQVLAAIDTIHSRGLLLRNIRPQNVFLASRRGCRPLVKITDFGLSRLVPMEKVQEQWGDAPGSLSLPYYFSPEHVRGEHTVEPASDLFVAAVLFYEALTGAKPFVSTSYDGLLMQLTQGRPQPLSELRADVPPEVDAVILRALANDPRARYASAKEMQEELRHAIESSGGSRRTSAGSLRAAQPPPPSSREDVPISIDSGAYTPRGAQPTPASVLVSAMRNQHQSGGPAVVSGKKQTGETSVVDMTASAREMDDVYADQTETNRNRFDLMALEAHERGMASAAISRPVSTAPRFDEASADNPQKTVRPPPERSDEIPIDVQLEPPSEALHDDKTTPGESVQDVLTLEGRPRGRIGEDEETETMQLTPELRQKIEQMTRREREPNAKPMPSDAPPETRRLSGKPPR